MTNNSITNQQINNRKTNNWQLDNNKKYKQSTIGNTKITNNK